jgi:hypothetical protein
MPVSDDFDSVLPMGHSCGSYRIGHRGHWIQGLRSAGATVVIRVSVAVHPGGLVRLRGEGLSLECWNHAPAAIQARRCPVIRTTLLCGGLPDGTWPGRNLHRYAVMRAMRSVDDG